ncbi:MAG: aminotransferase class I/II-fold pyridoxal phosphate-dependent enzyme, partial [Kiritimatiellia bacterium]|nr:aminotransferase class I/II-fold pyridoxal phosphate-dependent enzyme [Kiritimatiellia bacterium]
IRDGKTGYCPNYGIPALREALAEDLSKTHGAPYRMENVAIQPGGKPVIGKFILALMNPGDEVLYPNPGYPIYESQIEFHGGKAVPYAYREGPGNFEIDLEAIERAITPKTRFLIINDLQNPMGAEAKAGERRKLAELAVRHDLYVLLDEAYFELRYEGTSTSLVCEPGMQERSILLYTFSKKFAMTGWRLGAAIGPREVVDVIAKLNVNDESCSNHFIQYGALAGLTGGPEGPQAILKKLRERRDVCVDLLQRLPGVRCYKPSATFYLFPNVTELMRRLGLSDYEIFRRLILKETGVSFCSRLHFGRPAPDETERYIRFAYSGIDVDQIREGFGKLQTFLESRLR